MADLDTPRWARAALGVFALAAGGSALNTWRRSREITDDLHPPMGETIEVDGVALHHIDVGPRDAPAILFLHGNGACIEDLTVSGLIDVMSQHYRCIVPDRPGYGHSSRPGGRSYTPEDQAELMIGLLAALGVERPLVVGHSWGTLIAMALALHPREPVRGAVLMSGYYYPQDRSDVLVMSLPNTPVIGPALIWTLGPQTMRRMAPKLLARLFSPHPVPERIWDEYPHVYGERPKQMRAATAELSIMSRSAAELAPRYASCPVPLALIHGSEDKALPAALHTSRLGAEIPSARLMLLPGLGHMIHYFAHEPIRDAIDAVSAAASAPRLRAAGA